MEEIIRVQLSSSKSLRTSLESVRSGIAGLNNKRKKLLDKTSKSGDWLELPKESVTAKEAKKIGISACIEKLGVEFCRKYEANACTSWGRRGNKMHCSVGIDKRSSRTEKHLRHYLNL